MAGKSTIMRTVIAVALLGSCGLLAPAAAARLPYIDAFMLRTFSADAPTEGRSSFAVEMVEMRSAPAVVVMWQIRAPLVLVSGVLGQV